MTAAEVATTAFTLCNAVRVLAYLPQILRITQDPDGARAISCATWSLFAISHLTTVVYALVAAHDPTMAAVFGGNALACLLILGLTLFKRRLAKEQAAGRSPVGDRKLARP
jgi:uncharacterized protein with PQ loop repeat